MAEDERKYLSVAELDEMMTKGKDVHTFVNPNGMLLGCDMRREKILKIARDNIAELSGEMATRMDHGALVWDGKKPIFVETKR